MTVVGFDFGTTNSLVSVVAGDRAIALFDEEGKPTPSVVGYEGARTIAGHEAKRRLDSAGLGIHGNLVRSPKFLLGEDTVHVGGVQRSSIEVVRDAVRHVRQVTLESRRDIDLGGLHRAVVTIPVDFDGARRRALREAFARSDITISQFVHEPFAAVYAHLRQHGRRDDLLREYHRQFILVVDWGGGTLDLTLCRLDDRHLVQLKNAGTDNVGGDRFDEAIRNDVTSAFLTEAGMDEAPRAHADARTRLLEQCEEAKIALSTRSTSAIYVPAYFRHMEEGDFYFMLNRARLDRSVAGLVERGIRQIDELLERAGVAPAQVALVLATGGMANMPAIRSRLHELFGPQRVEVSDRSATLVSEGAAWVAHDEQPLLLAKRAEVRLARGSYFPLLEAGLRTPPHGSVERRCVSLYCADPRDGVAKFSICSPEKPGRNILQTDIRVPLAEMAVGVDANARPLRERLELDLQLDDDLTLTAVGRSLVEQDLSRVEIHDLEFGIRIPKDQAGGRGPDADAGLSDEPSVPGVSGGPFGPDVENALPPPQQGDLVVRANLAQSNLDLRAVPGELLYEHDPMYFDRRMDPPQVQDEERLYYAPCALCGKASNDPLCTCRVER